MGASQLSGIAKIDEQHEEIFKQFNKVVVMLSDGSAADSIIEEFERLFGMCMNHFNYEEHLLQTHGYPGLKKQRKDHEHFLTRFRDKRTVCRREEWSRLAADLIKLGEEFLSHVIGADRAYAEFLSENGVH